MLTAVIWQRVAIYEVWHTKMYIPVSSVFVFQLIDTDYANYVYFDLKDHFKIFSSKTAEPYLAKFGWDSPCVVHFQDYVLQLCFSFQVANVIRNINFFDRLLLLYYTPRKHSWGRGVYRNRPVCLSVCSDQLPHFLSDFHQTLWNLRSWCVNLWTLQYKGLYCPLSFTPVMPLWT